MQKETFGKTLEGFQLPKKKKSLKSIAVVMLILAIFIPLSVYGTMKVIEFRTQALPTENPQKVDITNVSDKSASITWSTPGQKTVGYVKYGTTSSLESIKFDNRDQGENQGEYFLHLVDLSDLRPETTYYYVIIVGGKEYKKNNDLYQFKTGPSLEIVRTPQPMKGSVNDPSNDNEEMIVFMYAEKGGKISNTLSTVTINKKYSFDLSNLRSADLSDYFTDFPGATLHFRADGGPRGEGTITTQIVE
jgi:hypothetical protein